MRACSTEPVPSLPDTTRHRAAARDALTGRIRRITGAAVAISALLSGAFAALAAASAPGRHLHPAQTATTKARTPAPARHTATRHSTTIPPLPPAAGPGNDAAPAPAPTPAPSAPAPTQAPPVVSSGGS